MGVVRVSGPLLILLALKFPHLPVHVHTHGPTFDYAGLALAAFASWIGVPGPGEPVLVATAVLAARHHLDLSGVLGVAFAAAVLGGIGGWLLGLLAGRKLLSGPGPLRRTRGRMLENGDRLFKRYPVIAIVLTPTFVAGIHRVRTGTFLVVNALSAALWTLGLGVGAYYAGPTVLDVFDDLGTVTSIVLGLLFAAVVAAALVRRRRRRAA